MKGENKHVKTNRKPKSEKQNEKKTTHIETLKRPHGVYFVLANSSSAHLSCSVWYPHWHRTEEKWFSLSLWYQLQKVSQLKVGFWLQCMRVCSQVCVCTMYMSVPAVARTASEQLLELELQNVMRCDVGAPTKPESSVKVLSAPCCTPMSPAPCFTF